MPDQSRMVGSWGLEPQTSTVSTYTVRKENHLDRIEHSLHTSFTHFTGRDHG
jgi:hypothetical protein